jgi:hypothetical protein
MKNLIERLEALTGPCRECDQDIHELAVMGLPKTTGYIYSSCLWFTRSIDAAMKLVPAEMESRRVGCTDDGRGYAELAKHDGHMMAEDPDEYYYEGEGATMPIALCIAALKARLA